MESNAITSALAMMVGMGLAMYVLASSVNMLAMFIAFEAVSMTPPNAVFRVSADVFLADQVGEVLWAPLTGEYQVGHGLSVGFGF